MSQCLLNATIQIHQSRCSCIHTKRCASSLRHARSHAFTSSPVASSCSSFAGTPLRASLSQKVAKQQQPTAGAVRCQATADKMVIAVTGRSSSVLCTQKRKKARLKQLYDDNAGATGLVGSRLVSRLSAQGHTVRVLTRNPDKARGKLPYTRIRFYNIQQQLQEALKGATGVVNLAGTVMSCTVSLIHKEPCHTCVSGYMFVKRGCKAMHKRPAWSQQPPAAAHTASLACDCICICSSVLSYTKVSLLSINPFLHYLTFVYILNLFLCKDKHTNILCMIFALTLATCIDKSKWIATTASIHLLRLCCLGR